MDINVSDVPDEQQFVATIEGKRAGVADYLLTHEGVIVFTHTEVDPAYEGKGVGSALARGGLDSARRSGLSVLPICPFIKGWINRHREFADLLYGSKPR